jgi:hypothetical protein
MCNQGSEVKRFVVGAVMFSIGEDMKYSNVQNSCEKKSHGSGSFEDGEGNRLK